MGELGNIKGKTFLITGGASGLGAGIAEAFLDEGAKKVAILDIAEEYGRATEKRLNERYPERTIFIKCDVAKEESIEQAFNEVIKNFETLDVIMNNAGIMNDSPNIWRTACNVNLQGLVSLTLKGLAHMRKDEGGKGGTIINVSSMLPLLEIPYLPIYAGCKAAVLFFSKYLAIDPFFEETGVRILTMCFGATDTPLLQNLAVKAYDERKGYRLHEIAQGRLQRPEAAVRGVIDMFKQGDCGSIWIVNNNKPAINFTSIVNDAFKTFQKAIQLTE